MRSHGTHPAQSRIGQLSGKDKLNIDPVFHEDQVRKTYLGPTLRLGFRWMDPVRRDIGSSSGRDTLRARADDVPGSAARRKTCRVCAAHSAVGTAATVPTGPRKRRTLLLAQFSPRLLVARLGFEPRLTDSESVVLPLHHRARRKGDVPYPSPHERTSPDRISAVYDSPASAGARRNSKT